MKHLFVSLVLVFYLAQVLSIPEPSFKEITTSKEALSETDNQEGPQKTGVEKAEISQNVVDDPKILGNKVQNRDGRNKYNIYLGKPVRESRRRCSIGLGAGNPCK